MPRFVVTALTLLFIAAPWTRAQESPSSPTPPSPTAADDLAQVQRQIDDLARSTSSGDAGKRAEAISKFCLPASEAWFVENFGVDNSQKLQAEYEKSFARFDRAMAAIFDPSGASPVPHVIATRLDSPAPAAENPAAGIALPIRPVATENFALKFIRGDDTLFSWLITFVRISDSYRFVGQGGQAFWATHPHHRIRVGGAVQQRKLIQKVQPEYPEEAKKQGITGTVRLRVLVDKDGLVVNVDAENGPSALLQAAIDAVRQWRYQPTLLNGEPIEVETFVDVTFQLNP